MRTKTLVITTALGVAGALTSMAQPVYSVNAVGYINVDLCAGFTIVANQLDAGAGNNTIGKLLAGVPEGTTVYVFGAPKDCSKAVYTDIYTYEFGSWAPNDTLTIAPGEAVFVKVPSATKVTFVGEVPQGTLTKALCQGFNLTASTVPQEAALDSVLGMPSPEGTTVYFFDCAKNAYDIYTYEFGAWAPSAPSPKVGQGFFVKLPSAQTWSRTFSVNN